MAKYKFIGRKQEYFWANYNNIYEGHYRPNGYVYNVKYYAKKYPEDWELVEEKTFPREMEVKFGNKLSDKWYKYIVLGIFNNRAVVVSRDYRINFLNGSEHFEPAHGTAVVWKEIPEKQEMTIAEIEKELGRSIKIVK